MTLPIGETALSFSLRGVDGEMHSLHDYADAELLAIVWSCNHCPYVLAWEDRLNAIARDYRDRGVRVVTINSNDAQSHPEDAFEAMQDRASTKRLVFDYLHDEDQSVAGAYEPERTPEVFLFDSGRRLVYHGAIDDNREEAKVERHWLREAIEATLANEAPAVAETPAVGCTIKWRTAVS
jgi:peroxiredoxin